MTTGQRSILYIGRAFSDAQLDAASLRGMPDISAALVSARADTSMVLLDLRAGKSQLGDLRKLRARLQHCMMVALVDTTMPIQTRLDATKAGCDDVLVVTPKDTPESLTRLTERLNDALVRRRILVVDDEENNRELLRQELTDANLEVLLAVDGPSALNKATRADLMLLDIMMPGMDGREVCKRLRANPDTSKLPIIVVSAMGEIKDKLQALELGANDYVTKPYDSDKLIDKVRRLLRQTAARGSHR